MMVMEGRMTDGVPTWPVIRHCDAEGRLGAYDPFPAVVRRRLNGHVRDAWPARAPILW